MLVKILVEVELVVTRSVSVALVPVRFVVKRLLEVLLMMLELVAVREFRNASSVKE
jgi:hypothetical protein